MSPTTVTGADMCTTLLSFINISLAFAHIASMRDSARSCFLYNCEIHSSRSILAVGALAQALCLPSEQLHAPGSPGIFIAPGSGAAQQRLACHGLDRVLFWGRESSRGIKCARGNVMMRNCEKLSMLSANRAPTVSTQPEHHLKRIIDTKHLKAQKAVVSK